MALTKYFKRLDYLPDPEGPLALKVPSKIIIETNKQVRKVSKKRGEYSKHSAEDRVEIGKYASKHGVAKAVRQFNNKDVKESTVRDWKKLYDTELKKMSKFASIEDVRVESLPEKTRGRPPLLGEKLDKYLKEIIIAMRSRGTAIGSVIVIAIARGILLKHDKRMLEEFGGSIKLTKSWAKNVMRRMGFSKRRANSKAKILPHDFDVVKEQYLIDIKSVVSMEEIPHQLIINWDQTPLKIAPSSNWTMEKRGTKRVEISAVDDKRQITGVFGCTLAGDFLPIQLIFTGTTKKCLPKVDFPSDWDITCTASHWSNESTMIKYMDHIIIPYVNKMRVELKLSSQYPALVLFDVFKGQCVESIFKKLEENNILYVLVPPNCTDRLQPLDLSVNKPAKDYMKRRFQEWFSNIIREQLEAKVHEEVDMRLSVLKPLLSQWTIGMYDFFKSNPNIIINGFKAAGICEELKNV